MCIYYYKCVYFCLSSFIIVGECIRRWWGFVILGVVLLLGILVMRNVKTERSCVHVWEIELAPVCDALLLIPRLSL